MRRTSTTATLLALLVGAGSVSVARPAAGAAEEPLPPVTPFIDSGNTDLGALARRPEVPPATRGTWYGWQILAGDLAVLTCLLSSKSGLCVVPYFGVGPAIHLAHDRGGLAAASFGLRTLGPGIGAAIGATIANCPERTPGDLDFCGLGQAAVGAAIGATVAVIVDAAIGFARAEPDHRPARPRTIEPELSVGPNRVSFGLAGSF